MKHVIKRNGEKGFSLVELMIVVGIIGILATLALPRFKQFQAKAKMGEAKNILSHIYTLEQSFSLDNNTFQGFPLIGRQANGSLTCNIPAAPNNGAQLIGFRLDPCVEGATNAQAPTPRYGYQVNQGPVNINTGFMAVASTGDAANNLVCPGNTPHFVGINHESRIARVNAAADRDFQAGATEAAAGVVCPN